MLEKSSHFKGPGQLDILLGGLSRRGLVRVRFAQLNPASDADVIEHLEEPFHFRITQLENKAQVMLSESPWFLEEYFQVAPIFVLLFSEGVFEQFLVFFCFRGASRVTRSIMRGDHDRVTSQ